MWKAYSDWSPTLSRLAHGTRVIASISASNLVSTPFTSVINAFVIAAENSSCQNPLAFQFNHYWRKRQPHFQNEKKETNSYFLKYAECFHLNQALKTKTKTKGKRCSVYLPELQTCQLYQQIEDQSYSRHFQLAPLTKNIKKRK